MKHLICVYSNNKDPMVSSLRELSDAGTIICETIYLLDLIRLFQTHGAAAVKERLQAIRLRMKVPCIFIDRVAPPLSDITEIDSNINVMYIISKVYLMVLNEFKDAARKFTALRLGPPWRMPRMTAQWHMLHNSGLNVGIPRYAEPSRQPDAHHDFKQAIITKDSNLYQWKAAADLDLPTPDAKENDLIIEKPEGDYFLVARIGSSFKILKTSSSSPGPTEDVISIFSQVTDYFRLEIGEGLIFRNTDLYTFGMVSNFLNTLDDREYLTATLAKQIYA